MDKIAIKEMIEDSFWIMPATPTFVETGVPYITSKNIKNGQIVFADVKYISREDYNTIAKNRPIMSNDILISMIGTLGEVAIVKDIYGEFYGQNVYLLRLNSKRLNYKFFLFFMNSLPVRRHIESKKNKSTQGYLKAEHIESLMIPNYSMYTQAEISEVLEKISNIINKRKNQINEFDKLIRSRFVEMFGDLNAENCRWDKCKMGDVVEAVDPQPSHRTPPISSDGIPYIGIAECNYRTMKIEFGKARKVGKNVLDEHLVRYSIDDGDFIIGKIGTIGKPFFIPRERNYVLSANTVLIKPNNEKISSQFLFVLFQTDYVDRQLMAERKSTSQPAFGIQKVRNIDIIVPPIRLQKQFATFVQQVEKLKIEVQKSLDETKILFDSLMQLYF